MTIPNIIHENAKASSKANKSFLLFTVFDFVFTLNELCPYINTKRQASLKAFRLGANVTMLNVSIVVLRVFRSSCVVTLKIFFRTEIAAFLGFRWLVSFT